MLASILLIINALWNFDSSQWNIKNYTIKDGLNSNRVYDIVQDHRGRYWIGSNAGLAYFDGYQFQYVGSENGIKISDIIDLYYSNKHIYSVTLNDIEAINITHVNDYYSSKLYPYSIMNRLGSECVKDGFNYYLRDQVLHFKGINLEVYKLDLPYHHSKTNKFRSLRADFKNQLNTKYIDSITWLIKGKYYLTNNKILEINKFGKLDISCSFNISDYHNFYLLDSSLFLYTKISDKSFYLYHISSLVIKKIIILNTILSFSEYQNNGFFFTTYKNGIFLYTLKNYQKKNLSNFNYSTFYQTANLLNEQTNLEIDPAIKKYGQIYQFYNGHKWVSYHTGIKSLIKLDKENFIFGQRNGTFFFNLNDDLTKNPKFIDSSWVLRLRKMDSKLFILTYDNFKLLEGKTKKVFKLKYKGGYVLVNDLEYFNHQYVLGTNDQGVFVSDSGFKKFKHVSESDGLQSKLVKRIKTDKQGKIWVLNDKGVDRINKDLTVTRVFSIAEIDDYDIENFSVSKDSLWLFTDNTVYSLDYAKRFQEKKIPIVLNTINVDNETKYYEADTNICIGPRWETIKINYAGIYIHEQDHILYKYRIVRNGDTGSWQKTKSNLLTLAALKSGNYLVQIQAFHDIYPNVHSEILNTQFVIKPYFYQTWWFYGLATFVILGSILGFLWYRNQLRLKALKLEAELNRYRLAGLQNQMNPHFVFNSMSTIQNLILNNDKEEALNFISDFSTLMRTMLQNARNDQISLVNELEFLQKYIDLEKIRYRNSFDYSLDLGIDEFELEDIYIPTMMVQPLLENAVKHGVSNLSDRPGLIILKLALDETNDNLLIIKIIDNGHGQSTHGLKNHSSTALKVIKERLAIYSNHGIFGSLDIQFTPEGTICTLKLPI